MAINPALLPARPPFEHTGKRPRYLAEGEWSKDATVPHEPDAAHNAQGDWYCRQCGELVRLVSAN